MAYEYDVDILAALWTGGEDGEEPYASIIAANPDLFDEDSENRILSTIEALRSHMELLADRDEARLFHFCMSTMLEGFGSGGFVYGATSNNENAAIEGNVPNPVYAAGDEIEFWEIEGVYGVGGAPIALVASDDVGAGTTLADVVDAINANGALTAAGITARATPDQRLRIEQAPVGGATRAAGFAIVTGGGDATAANTNITTKSGIVVQEPGARALQTGGASADDVTGGYYLPKVIEVANKARDRAVRVYLGQIRDPALV